MEVNRAETSNSRCLDKTRLDRPGEPFCGLFEGRQELTLQAARILTLVDFAQTSNIYQCLNVHYSGFSQPLGAARFSFGVCGQG